MDEDESRPANVLEEAAALVDGSRQDAYGHPRDNYRRLAAMWSAYLGIEITPVQAVDMMIAVKLSRQANAPKRDNLVDIAGYARVAEMVSELDLATKDEKEPRTSYGDKMRQKVTERKAHL